MSANRQREMNEGAGGGGQDGQRPPKFSIIIPVYNVAPYLRECLDSVLAQTYTDWEAICVDDGSTDDSGAILDEYAAKDRRFRVIHQKNAGVSVARNTALDVSNGKWITFLDPDDVVNCDWLEELSRLTKQNTDIVRINGTEWHGESGDFLSPGNRINESNEDLVYRDSSTAQSWGWNTLWKYGAVWTLGVKRSIIADVRFPEGVCLGEDILFCFDLLESINSVCQSNYAGYLYRQREDSALKVKTIDPIERSRFFKRLDEIKAKPKDQMQAKIKALRNFYSYAFFNWISKSIITLYGDPINEKLRDLVENGWIVAPKNSFHFRICLWIYAKTGCLFPFCVAYFLIYVKDVVSPKIQKTSAVSPSTFHEMWTGLRGQGMRMMQWLLR